MLIYNLCLQLNWKHWGNYSVHMLIQFWMITGFLLAVQVNADPLYSDYFSQRGVKDKFLATVSCDPVKWSSLLFRVGNTGKSEQERCLGWFKSFEVFSPWPWSCHRLWNASLMLMSWVIGSVTFLYDCTIFCCCFNNKLFRRWLPFWMIHCINNVAH